VPGDSDGQLASYHAIASRVYIYGIAGGDRGVTSTKGRKAATASPGCTLRALLLFFALRDPCRAITSVERRLLDDDTEVGSLRRKVGTSMTRGSSYLPRRTGGGRGGW